MRWNVDYWLQQPFQDTIVQQGIGCGIVKTEMGENALLEEKVEGRLRSLIHRAGQGETEKLRSSRENKCVILYNTSILRGLWSFVWIPMALS